MSYFRQNVKSFSTIAEPLHRLEQDNAKFEWTIEQEQVFMILRDVLSKPSVLAHYEPETPFELPTDASGVGLDVVVIQTYSEERVVFYGSRLLSWTKLS